jgi:hypothetical protein
MYNEKALEFDSKHIENWREDANGLMILVSHRHPFHYQVLPDHYMTEWSSFSHRRWILVKGLY